MAFEPQPPHAPLDDIRGKYELLSLAGHSETSAVYVAKELSTGQLVAVRIIPRGSCSAPHLEEQLASHHAVSRHPHVVALKETFATRDALCIVMELATGGTLLDHIQHSRGRLPEPAARNFLQQLALAVDYCHRKGVQLRDLKLESILLQPARSSPDNPLLKITAFGPTPPRSPDHPNSRVVTLVYAAPEVIQALDYDTHQADVWSIGVILFTMLAGTYPFLMPSGPDLHAYLSQMLHDMAARDVRLPPHVAASPLCHDLIFRMLDPDPATRITLPQVLRHPWFTVDLPPGFDAYNDQLLQAEPPEAGTAAVAEIRRAVQQAASPLPKPHAARPIPHPVRAPASAAAPAAPTPKAAA